VEVLAQVLNTLIGQGVVVVLPRELGLDELLGVQGLESLDDLEVRDIDLIVLGGVEVLLGDQDTICIQRVIILSDSRKRSYEKLQVAHPVRSRGDSVVLSSKSRDVQKKQAGYKGWD